MMVVLLILTICLAAFAPLMTKRRTVDISSPWRYSSNNSDIYYGMGSTQTAMIGQNSKSADDNAKLIINTNDSNQRHAIFKQAGTKVGELRVDGGNFLLGSVFWDSFTGTNNTAFGYYALPYNTTGTDNTAIGKYTLATNYGGSMNVAVGTNALLRHTGGHRNTAIGAMALTSDVTGSHNTAVGNEALFSNTSGTYNTAIGVTALWNSATGHANTAIGNFACGNVYGSNKTCLGANSGPAANDSSTTNIVYLGSSSTTGIVSGVSSISVYSDKRLKDVKDEYKKGLEQIREVVPKLFVYKSDKEKNIRLGVIAQELQKVLPEAVVKNGDGYLIVHQEYIQYALLNAVKQLDKIMQSLITEVKTMVAKLSYHDNKIKKLEQECADLKQENAELKARLEKLEKFVF